MLLNGFDLIDRQNRPSVTGRVALRAFFLNDGEFYDPYDVSACTVFSKYANTTPDSIVDPLTGLIKTDQAVDTILMNFGVSGGDPADSDVHDGTDGQTTSQNLDWVSPTLYGPGSSASGIYRVSSGDYVAVLDGGVALSGGYNIHYGFNEGITVVNGASAVSDYIDVWTVKMSPGSEYQLFINTFQLFNDTFISITEPLLLTTSNRLVNKHVTLSSTVDLLVTTEITINNRGLSESVKNIIEDYGITSAQIQIQKVNEDSTNLPARETVVGWTPVTNVTSDNTMIYKFAAIGTTLTGLQGGPVGTFILTAKYNFIGQTLYTEPFYFVIS